MFFYSARLWTAIGIMALSLSTATQLTAASCGQTTIANLNWASASLLAHIDHIILKHGFECDTQSSIIAGDTLPTFTSMIEKAYPDIVPEMWEVTFGWRLQKAVDEGKLYRANQSPLLGSGSGLFVTEALHKAHPELTSVEDIIEHPELFPHPEDPSKGAFYGCPTGWACQPTMENTFKAYRMAEKGWRLVNPGSAAGLEGAISKASHRNEPWFGYYWAPTATISEYNLKKLHFKSGYAGDENWSCMTTTDCSNPKPTDFPPNKLSTVITTQYKERNPMVLDYLAKRQIPTEEAQAILLFMKRNQADGETAAYEFLKRYPQIWSQWLTAEQAEKVKKALQS